MKNLQDFIFDHIKNVYVVKIKLTIELTVDKKLDHLGFSFRDKVKLIEAIEKEYKIEISDDVEFCMDTIKELIEYVQAIIDTKPKIETTSPTNTQELTSTPITFSSSSDDDNRMLDTFFIYLINTIKNITVEKNVNWTTAANIVFFRNNILGTTTDIENILIENYRLGKEMTLIECMVLMRKLK